MSAITYRFLLGSFLALSLTASASGAGKAVATPKGDLKWVAAATPGVATAVVEGDMAKGASHFYLKYPAGLVTPISGELVIVAGGAEHRLAPGSYFSLDGKAPHVARCEGAESCVMFIDARGPWDVVMEGKPNAKP